MPTLCVALRENVSRDDHHIPTTLDAMMQVMHRCCILILENLLTSPHRVIIDNTTDNINIHKRTGHTLRSTTAYQREVPYGFTYPTPGLAQTGWSLSLGGTVTRGLPGCIHPGI